MDFYVIFIRTSLSIIITSIKNLFDSYRWKNQIIISPDTGKLDSVENALRNPIAVDYFYDYLESKEASSLTVKEKL